ncbi:hypothetical protein BYT27DRAFT_7259274 [Phlegmacium glaucopus]|nr:hypothetical protein BYT27DRAFT_7259274 [Phlegmacium glaucopus]
MRRPDTGIDLASGHVDTRIDFTSPRHWHRLYVAPHIAGRGPSQSSHRPCVDNQSYVAQPVAMPTLYRFKPNQAYISQNDTYNDALVENNVKSTLIIDNNDMNPTP